MCPMKVLLLTVASTLCLQASSNDTGPPESTFLQAQVRVRARQPIAMPEHRRRQRRWLENGTTPDASSENGDEVPVHRGYGTHYSYIYVGTPPQRVSVILDTGSHFTAFPCTGCRECGTAHTDEYFDPAASSSFHALNCDECQLNRMRQCKHHRCPIGLSYVEGSTWEGYEARDVVYLGGDSSALSAAQLAVPFTFGCQTHETGLFRSQLEDGIMGLAMLDPSIVYGLKSAGRIADNVFSLCLTTSGGSFTVGGADVTQHRGPIEYVELVRDDGFYTVTLVDVRIGNTSLGLPPDVYSMGASTIIDSGTTDTSLPVSMRGAFGEAFKLATQDHWGAYSDTEYMPAVSPDRLSGMPDVVFVFANGVTQTMPASSYMDCNAKDDKGDRTGCVGALQFEGKGTVLGANFMRNKDVIFDNQLKRVGFAPAVCNEGDTKYVGRGPSEPVSPELSQSVTKTDRTHAAGPHPMADVTANVAANAANATTSSKGSARHLRGAETA